MFDWGQTRESDCCVCVVAVVFVATSTASVTIAIAINVIIVVSSSIRMQGQSSISWRHFPSTVLHALLAAGRWQIAKHQPRKDCWCHHVLHCCQPQSPNICALPRWGEQCTLLLSLPSPLLLPLLPRWRQQRRRRLWAVDSCRTNACLRLCKWGDFHTHREPKAYWGLPESSWQDETTYSSQLRRLCRI